VGDEDIRRLDVAVGDPFGMRSIQRVSNLNRQVNQRVSG
jgi:hypothetical protein